jgi:heme-degrading monooxygenase HmoA
MIVVVFKNELREGAAGPEYEALAERMWEIVSKMPGFVGLDAFSSPEGNETAIITFESEAALAAWRNHPEHLEAQRRGQEEFYRSYHIQVCEVLRDYRYPRPVEGSAETAGGP